MAVREAMTVMLASGASGGHLFPALAVAEALREKGVRCVFVLGGGKFGEKVSEAGFELRRLPAGAFNVRNPLRRLFALVKLALAFVVALRAVWKEQPAVVLGTGGYASVATVLAAKVVGIPTLAHEQNVLPGRANRILARIVDCLLLTFEESRDYLPKGVATDVTGTPLRAHVLAASSNMPLPDDGAPFGILILGGSKGSKVVSHVAAEAIALMTPAERANLRVVHQARADDVAYLQRFYEPLGLKEFTVRAFFDDLPAEYRHAHLVIGRSGTGTFLETALLGRAAIYSPHQLADNHQKLNADVAERAGAAVVLDAPVFTPANLLVQVRSLMTDTVKLRAMAQAGKTLAVPDATARVVAALERAVQDDVLRNK